MLGGLEQPPLQPACLDPADKSVWAHLVRGGLMT
jgi:hypothetical protein